MDIYLQVGHMFVKLFEHVYKPIGLVHMESIKCSGPTNNPQIKENEKEYVEKSVSSSSDHQEVLILIQLEFSMYCKVYLCISFP